VARTAQPYLNRGWYCTSFNGVVNRKLCREEEGFKKAESELARLRVQQADAQQQERTDPPPHSVTGSGTGWPMLAPLIDPDAASKPCTI